MRETEILIVGAGLAGSVAATMLARAGRDVVIVDPRPIYRPEFRCEKVDGEQMKVLEKAGLADVVRRVATPEAESWVARRGRIVEKSPGHHWAVLYQDLVNAMRAEIPESVSFINAMVSEIENSPQTSVVTLSDGQQIRARLVIMANGLNFGLREQLGISRRILSANHSISLGFDLEAEAGPLRVPSLTYFSDRPSDGICYITLFWIGQTLRANLFVYRQPDDPWLREFKATPARILCDALPGIEEMVGAFRITGDIKIRPADLYRSEPVDVPGVVLVGDAYSTSCPAAGTGTLKVFTDVERLCNVYVPRWLATDGMGSEKIAAFYTDPAKTDCEAFSYAKAVRMRKLFTGTTLLDHAHRWIRFQVRRFRFRLQQAGMQLMSGNGRVRES